MLRTRGNRVKNGANVLSNVFVYRTRTRDFDYGCSEINRENRCEQNKFHPARFVRFAYYLVFPSRTRPRTPYTTSK